MSRADGDRLSISSPQDEVLATVSHDLRPWLAVVTMSAELMRAEAPPGHPGALVRRRSAAILRAAATMQRLLDDLIDAESLALGRPDVRPEWCDLGALVTEAVEQFAPVAAAKGVALSAEVGVGSLRAQADRVRILQVLSNLVDNGVKFAPGGSVVVCAETVGRGMVRLAVVDTGQGIPADQIATIFGRFAQGPSELPRQGLGLGLFIAKWIVEAHGAQLSVASEPGAGTMFSFTLGSPP